MEESLINQLRSEINEEISNNLTNKDCERFLIARKLNLENTIIMINDWWKWWNTPLNAYNNPTPANILTIDSLEDPNEELAGELCPHALYGEDIHGNPIYWEKTGIAESRMSEIKQHFDMDYLLARHIRQQTIMLMRLDYCSKKYGKEISKLVVVFDLEGLSSFPDLFALDYTRRVLLLDQAYYPERLETIYLVNAPWYFAAIYSLISSFLDPVTAKKVQILGSDFLPTLRQQIDDSQIPRSMGGSCDTIKWNWPYTEESGVSPQQLRSMLEKKGNQSYQIEEINQENEINKNNEIINK